MVTLNWLANNIFRKLDQTNQTQECLRSQDTQKNHTEQSRRLHKMTEVYIVKCNYFFLNMYRIPKANWEKKERKNEQKRKRLITHKALTWNR